MTESLRLTTKEGKKNMSNDDFQTISNDVEGFWTGSGHITFVPMHAHLCDNGADKTKASTLIIGKLVEASELSAENELVECEAGALVGVWYSPGMRPVLQCAGVTTRIMRDETKDKKLEGRPTPMKGFDVATKGGKRGSQLTVLEDYRKQSRNAATPFDEPAKRAETQSQISESEVPF